MNNFSALGLIEPMLRTLRDAGYTTPTEIQAQAIPPALLGRNILGCAQTGTGKTAAFGLPLIQQFMLADQAQGQQPPRIEEVFEEKPDFEYRGGRGERNRRGRRSAKRQQELRPFRPLRALILVPTRELAVQVAESIHLYANETGLRVGAVYGGVSYFHQINMIKQGVDFLVATPGRLVDLLGQGFGDLSTIKAFVLDEADLMLDMGFMPDLKRIIKRLPVERQTLFFSATMPREIADLVNEILRDPVTIKVAPQQPAAERIEQSVCFVPKAQKPALLTQLLDQKHVNRAIVFTRTKRNANDVTKKLLSTGFKADVIHGNKSQNARQRTLNAFRDDKLHVLVATDVAARGIDIDGISHVFNYDMPTEPETYVHRIGRTARAGASGIAISFCDREERGKLRDVERLLKTTLPINRDVPAEHQHEAKSHHSDRQDSPSNLDDFEQQERDQPRPNKRPSKFKNSIKGGEKKAFSSHGMGKYQPGRAANPNRPKVNNGTGRRSSLQARYDMRANADHFDYLEDVEDLTEMSTSRDMDQASTPRDDNRGGRDERRPSRTKRRKPGGVGQQSGRIERGSSTRQSSAQGERRERSNDRNGERRERFGEQERDARSGRSFARRARPAAQASGDRQPSRGPKRGQRRLVRGKR